MADVAAQEAPSPAPYAFAPGPQEYMGQAPYMYAYPLMNGNSAGMARIIIATVIAALVLLLALIIYMLWREGQLPRRLARAGWVLYVQEGCGYCDRQLALLGGRYPKLVLCAPGGAERSSFASPPLACSQIKAYPLWYNTKVSATRTGLQSRAELAAMARMN